MSEINANTPMKDMTIGGNIYEAGNARNFKTGDWRSVRPVYIEEKCKQCGLCFPVCPDNAIPVNKELNMPICSNRNEGRRCLIYEYKRKIKW